MLMIAHITVIPGVPCPWKPHLFTEVFSALSKATGDQQWVHLLPQRGLWTPGLWGLCSPCRELRSSVLGALGLCSAGANSDLPSASHFEGIYCH